MAYEYSNTKLASNTWLLPNIEVFSTPIYIVACDHCRRDDENHVPACIECGDDAKIRAEKTERVGFWWWTCLPGCLPDSDAFGPFATYDAALADAREQYDHECIDDDAEGSN